MAPTDPTSRRGTPPGVRRLCVAYDVEDYSIGDNQRMLTTQERLARVVGRACAASGLGEDDYRVQQQGDGGIALLPTGGEIDDPLLIATFIRTLESELREINRDLVATARTRLRVALNEGVVFEGAHGYAGDAVNDAARMRDAAPVRRALAGNPDCHLAVVVSDGLHRGVLRHGDHGVPGDAFVRYPLVLKQFSGFGWVYVPGGDATLAGEKPAEAGTAAPPAEPRARSFLRDALDGDGVW